MIHVAFVCLGNICRSPMAEAIMRQRLQERGISDIKVHSRGTGRWNLGELHITEHKNSTEVPYSYDGMVSELSNLMMILTILLLWTKVT